MDGHDATPSRARGNKVSTLVPPRKAHLPCKKIGDTCFLAGQSISTPLLHAHVDATRRRVLARGLRGALRYPRVRCGPARGPMRRYLCVGHQDSPNLFTRHRVASGGGSDTAWRRHGPAMGQHCEPRLPTLWSGRGHDTTAEARREATRRPARLREAPEKARNAFAANFRRGSRQGCKRSRWPRCV